MEVRLLMIDDNPADLMAFSRIIKKSYVNPQLSLKVATLTEPPTDRERLLSYDGLILDERMGATSGIDLAAEVHRLDWTIPIMIISGLPPEAEDFNNALAYVDYVVSKQQEGMFLQVFVAFVRQIQRVKRGQLSAQNSA